MVIGDLPAFAVSGTYLGFVGMSGSISGWEHEGGSGGFGRVLLLSAIGHAVVLGALVLVPLHSRPKHVYLPSYTVNLVEVAPPAPVVQEKPKVQVKSPPAAKKAEPSAKAKPPSSAKKKAPAKKKAMAEPLKIAPIEVRQWKPKVAPEPEKVARTTTVQTRKPLPTPRDGLSRFGHAVTSLPQPSRSAMVDVDFPYVYYLTIIQNKIGENWRPPLDAYLSRETRRAVIMFTILRTGQVVNVEVEGSSGTRLLDESALRAVEFSSPLPPLPGEFAGDRLRVHFNFEFAERG